MHLNHSNHLSHLWDEKQKVAAKDRFGMITALTFPDVSTHFGVEGNENLLINLIPFYRLTFY